MIEEYNIKDPKRGRIWVLAVLLVLILVGSSIIYFFTKVNQASSSESATSNFVIEKGMGTKQVGQKLSDEGVINNSFVFTLYIYSKNASGKIQAGEYLLDRKMSIAEIVEVITKGRVVSNEHKITVVEGWSNKQIGRYLAQRNILTEEQFQLLLKNKYDFKFSNTAQPYNYEGFLFPDTYSLSKNASVDVLVEKMLNNFESKLSAEIIADMEEKSLKLSDVVILASIVEKEVGRNKEKLDLTDKTAMQHERELVASVFYNRLASKMALQSDATVNYITGKGDRRALITDTQIKSPYNTYQVVGLPPGPIGNPGIESIKAVVYPADSDYLYFLNSPDGTAYFAKTLEEHNQNRAKYLD